MIKISPFGCGLRESWSLLRNISCVSGMMGKTLVNLKMRSLPQTFRLPIAPSNWEVVCAEGGSLNWKNLQQMNSSSEESSDEATAKSKNIRSPSCPI